MGQGGQIQEGVPLGKHCFWQRYGWLYDAGGYGVVDDNNDDDSGGAVLEGLLPVLKHLPLDHRLPPLQAHPSFLTQDQLQASGKVAHSLLVPLPCHVAPAHSFSRPNTLVFLIAALTYDVPLFV